MWQTFYRSVDALSRLMGWVAGGLILLIALMQMAEIIMRNVVGTSLLFVWEFAAYMHVAAIFLGLSLTLRTGGHIQVALLANTTPRVFNYLSTVGGLAISSYASLALIRLAWNWGITGRTSATVANVPLVYPMAFVAFGATMLSVQLLLRLVHLLRGTDLELGWADGPSAE